MSLELELGWDLLYLRLFSILTMLNIHDIRGYDIYCNM